MLLRIVKLQFRPSETKAFIEDFESVKAKIRAFDGCHGVRLMRDSAHEDVFFTISKWQSHIHLEQYRRSELFRNAWQKTKARFSERPEAWSLEGVK